jgi:riboflavin synthase
MFTGLVEGRGTIAAVHPQSGGARLTVTAPWLDDVAEGDSVAVNGCCLTAAEVTGDGFTADLVAETLRRTTLGRLVPGDTVNLERPLTAGARLGGHIVQGHVDGVGEVLAVTPAGDGAEITVGLDPGLARYVVEKGSIAIDGVSLTVAGTGPDRFTVALIPTTLAVTTLGARRPGDQVQLEVDVVAKYVERLLTPYQGSAS